MEKRKKRDTKKVRKPSRHRALTVGEKRTLKIKDIDNCVSIYLSPQTQRFIGCQIGEDITPERPWIDVKKEKIEDNLYLHENSSEFLALRSLIGDYPENDMLIGSYRTNQESAEKFMICITVEAKHSILDLLAKEKEALIQRVKQSIYCQANPWISLGSEAEVDATLNVNHRPLLEILFDSKMPILIGLQKIKLKYRFASIKPELRTYDEIIPDRRFYKRLIFKVRIDRASQISPEQFHIKCQTILPYPTNKYTQTDEVFYVLQLTEPENDKLNEVMKRTTKFMEDTLLVNFHINLYSDDYNLPNAYKQSYARDSKELMNFHDVVTCKDLFYGSVSWNALISGLIAVSYVERPIKLIVNQNYVDLPKTHSFRLYSDKITLLWCYSDNLAAKLYMHANFEITCISFCPYDQTILVGGGACGQIVIWDLKHKLKQAESKEYLSITELSHRNLVRNFTSWVKWPPGVRHVFPTIISDMTVSHKSPVISIQWLPSYHRLTKLGQVVETKPDGDISKYYLDPTKSYQFLTCSLEDSCVLAWEIKQSPHLLKPEHSKKKKNRRLTHWPETLIEGISPLKKYNQHFHPFFKLNLEVSGSGDRRIFVTDLILSNPKLEYEVLNPHTLDNIRERTFFQEKVPLEPEEHSQTFVVCSTNGKVVECKWNANNFDQGQIVNEQTCECTDLLAIHDGPIVSCRSYIHYPKCILTVGGTVFGIWVTSAIKRPIFWRKGVCRYVAGLWSVAYPLLCLILREDNYIEFWDLLDYTTTPIRRTKLKGSQVMDVLSDSTKSLQRKGTYLLTDIKGVMKVQDLPVFNTIHMSKEECEKHSAHVIKKMLKRKKHVEDLNERLKKKYDSSKTNIEQCRNVTDPVAANAKSEFFESGVHQTDGKKRPTRATRWQHKEEARMYETLVQQKHINIEELKKNTIPLMEKLNKRLIQQKKIDEVLADKENEFNRQKQRVLQSFQEVKSKKFTVSFPLEMESIIKEQYLLDYKLIEKEALEHISTASQRFVINWETVLGQQKSDINSRKMRVNIMDKRRFSSISVDPNTPRDILNKIVFDAEI